MIFSEVLSSAVVLFLAFVFAWASWHKLSAYLEFTGILNQYRLLPESAVPVAAPAVIAAEIATALMLLFPASRVFGSLAAALMLVIYGVAMGINLLRGRREIDCGCGGPPTPLNEWLVVRNGLMSGAALWAAVYQSTEARARPDVAETIVIVATVALLGTLYVISNQLVANLKFTESRN
jgi:hypothetical protein